VGMIEIDGLTRKFGEFTAVDHISFGVEKGEIIGLLGPNGAGKSTVMRMLSTLLRPTEGKATVAGFDITQQASGVREHIGLVTEKVILYSRLTATENLTLFGRLNHMPEKTINARIDKWLKSLQMWEWRNKQVGTYSTGMKQRINIARALLHQPDVLFLDEPTLGLDPQTTRSIREFIYELSQQGLTIVLSTHIMIEADMLCHRVGIIDHGKIAALDTPANLKKIISSSETTVLNVDITNLNDELFSIIKGVDCVASIVQNDEHQVTIHTQGDDATDKVIDTIRQNNGKIHSVTTIEPTLEDVFLYLTGRGMRDEVKEKKSLRKRGPLRRLVSGRRQDDNQN